MEGLVRDEQGTVKLRLAKEIIFLPENKIRIQLHHGVRWSDGSELLAEDFIESWRRLLTRCKVIDEAKFFFPIRNARAFCTGKRSFSSVGIKAPSSDALEIQLASPSSDFAISLARKIFWPRHREASKALTLGPFTQAGAGLYRRNGNYFGQLPLAESIQFLAIANAEERSQLFREGFAEILEDLPERQIPLFYATPELVFVPTHKDIWLGFSSQARQLGSIETRRALLAAFHPKEALELLKLPLLDLLPPTKGPQQLSPIKVALSWEKEPNLAPIAENLAAQWAAKLGAEVELVPPTQSHPPAGAYLFTQIAKEPPSSPPREESYLRTPLFRRGRPCLRSNQVEGLVMGSDGEWEFEKLKWR